MNGRKAENDFIFINKITKVKKKFVKTPSLINRYFKK